MTSYAGTDVLELYAESLKGVKALNDDPVTVVVAPTNTSV